MDLMVILNLLVLICYIHGGKRQTVKGKTGAIVVARMMSLGRALVPKCGRRMVFVVVCLVCQGEERAMLIIREFDHVFLFWNLNFSRLDAVCKIFLGLRVYLFGDESDSV